MTKTSENGMRIGKAMQRVADYVKANPGCTMLAAAEHAGANGSRRYGYEACHNAIRAGLAIKVERKDRRRAYRLYLPGGAH